MAKGKFKVDAFFFGEGNQKQWSNKYFTYKHCMVETAKAQDAKSMKVALGFMNF